MPANIKKRRWASDLRLAVFGTLVGIASVVCAQQMNDPYNAECGPLKVANKHGPFDYNTATEAERQLVERVHFTEHYQAYRKGLSKFQKNFDHIIESPAAGFGYTLWAFPNHPLALAAMEDIGFKEKGEYPIGRGSLSVQCYFQRAVKFKPTDPLVRVLFAYYYARRGQADHARSQLSRLSSLDGNMTMNIQVYSAFSYLELKDYEKAREAAKAAYQLGYPFAGLSERLKRLGKWDK